LCGKDQSTGQDYEHRRAWIEQRILMLGQVFCIDVCAYAVMSNHYHVVLHINQEAANQLNTRAIHERWNRLFKGNVLSARYLRQEPLCDAELAVIEELATTWKERLTDLSWFMRVLNEGIAREANREDQCTGRFWEGRFKSQALLDEQALAACMAYVDLNPIRASIADTPEQSDHTSAQQRIQAAQQTQKNDGQPNQPKTLFPFVGNPRQPMPVGLPFKLEDYLELLDWTGRCLREDKRGAINSQAPPILARLNINAKNWLYSTQYFERNFKGFAGKLETLKTQLLKLGYRRTPNAGVLLT
jgi:REP element-mobilizing transposase RayT